jgi:hypothetical protein
MGLAKRKLLALTGQPGGRDWQTWSAAIYRYAAECVREQRISLFDQMRAGDPNATE